MATKKLSTASARGVSAAGHTIHPKLSLSAKRPITEAEIFPLMMPTNSAGKVQENGTKLNGTNAGTTAAQHFQLTIRISNAENGAPITFKQDGSRFGTSQRTLKLHANCKYRVTVACKPAQDFLSLHLGGSDLELVAESAPGSGEYSAVWNTTGIDPTRRGARQDILLVLSGPGKTLTRKLQTKFYPREDSHAGTGHRVEALCWSCELDPLGQVRVADERLI